jgi:tetratricopeptide (TPR) repeat protein
VEANPEQFQPRFQLARFLHLKGARGDEDAAKEALQKLKQLHEAHPDKAVVTSYLGGAVMLSAKRQFWPWNKKDKLEEARTLLNQAVDQASVKFQPRLLRGIAVSHLPESLGQQEKAHRDLKWAVQQVKDREKRDAIDAGDAAAAHYHFGRVLAASDETDEALDHWRRAAELAPESYAGIQARAALDKHTN